MIKPSTLLFIVIFLFLSFAYASYDFIYKHLNITHEKNKQIAFNDIKYNTSKFLSKLMQSYHKQKDEIFEKHKIVYEYFLDNKTDKNLDEIYEIINQNTKNSPYNIYVTDDNFIVKNTTYKKDLHLDLNFAKDTFFRA